MGVEFDKTDTLDGSGMLKTIRNRSDFVKNGSEMSWTGQETDSERRAVRWGWTENILGNILQRGLRLGFGGGLDCLARLEYGARGLQTSFSLGHVGYSGRMFRRRVWAPVSSYGWNLHCGMIKMCFWQLWKFKYILKTLLFSDERGSDTDCCWEKPLVVALKHSEGIKHTVLFQQQKAYKD